MVGNRTALALFLGYAVLLVFSFVYLYPFLIQLTTSFKTNADAVQNPLSLIADPFTTSAFERLFDTDFPLWFFNSVVVTVSSPSAGSSSTRWPATRWPASSSAAAGPSSRPSSPSWRCRA